MAGVGSGLSFINFQPDIYDKLLKKRVLDTTNLFRDNKLLSNKIKCEIHSSPAKHYRQRVGFGIYDISRPAEYRESLSCKTNYYKNQELYYVYWDTARKIEKLRITILRSGLRIIFLMVFFLGTQREDGTN